MAPLELKKRMFWTGGNLSMAAEGQSEKTLVFCRKEVPVNFTRLTRLLVAGG